MLDVYVLHDESDQLLATRLLTGLLEASLVAEAGQSGRSARSAASVIVCWSPKAIANANLIAAARQARAQGRLLQSKVKPCDVPAAFGEIDGVILDGWNGERADAGFLRLVNAVKSLAGGAAPKRAAPRGVGWRGRFARRPLVWTLSAVTALAGAIGVLVNLNTGKTWMCSAEPIHGLCRKMGIIGPPKASILSRIEGRWTPNTCDGDVFELTASDDGATLYLDHAGQRTAATVQDQSGDSVTVEYAPPEGGLETTRWQRVGALLKLSMPNSNGFTPTDYKPCPAA